MADDDQIQIVYEGRFLQYVINDGYEYIRRHNCTGIVIVVAQTVDRKLIFVDQFRPPVNKRVIEFTAGLVSDSPEFAGEMTEVAAKRELMEETGYRADKVIHMTTGPASGGSSADLVSIFLALDVKKTGCGGGDDSEDIIVHEVSVDQVDQWLEQMTLKGYLIEPKIYAGLYFLNQYNKNLIVKEK